MKTILITGASAGLGLALSQRLITLPYRLVLTARAESMSRFAEMGIDESARVRLRALDVTKAAEREALVEEIVRDWKGVDVLINNAGISYRAVVEQVHDPLPSTIGSSIEACRTFGNGATDGVTDWLRRGTIHSKRGMMHANVEPALTRCQYRIDGQNRICFLNEGWTACMPATRASFPCAVGACRRKLSSFAGLRWRKPPGVLIHWTTEPCPSSSTPSVPPATIACGR